MDWTHDWPTEPGLYLFYGGYGTPQDPRFKPRVKLCRASWAGTGETRHLMLVADGAFLYQTEQSGLFQPLQVQTPDWPAAPGPVPGLSEADQQAITDMFRWRDMQTDLWGEELELHLNDFFYTRSPGEVPEGRRPALRVFQDLSNMEQAALVKAYCLAHDSSRR